MTFTTILWSLYNTLLALHLIFSIYDPILVLIVFRTQYTGIEIWVLPLWSQSLANGQWSSCLEVCPGTCSPNCKQSSAVIYSQLKPNWSEKSNTSPYVVVKWTTQSNRKSFEKKVFKVWVFSLAHRLLGREITYGSPPEGDVHACVMSVLIYNNCPAQL